MTCAVPLGGRLYRVVPDMKTICEIEEELGGVAELAQRFRDGLWQARELVSLTHILLHAAGHTADYRVLGDRMLAEGLSSYADGVLRFLDYILHGEKQ